MVQGKRLLSFFNGCGDGGIRRNGRSKQGKDALACVPRVLHGCKTIQAHTDARPTKSECDSADVKPYKHTDTRLTKSECDSSNAEPYKHTQIIAIQL